MWPRGPGSAGEQVRAWLLAVDDQQRLRGAPHPSPDHGRLSSLHALVITLLGTEGGVCAGHVGVDLEVDCPSYRTGLTFCGFFFASLHPRVLQYTWPRVVLWSKTAASPLGVWGEGLFLYLKILRVSQIQVLLIPFPSCVILGRQ